MIVGGYSNPWPALLWLTGVFCLIWLPFKRSRAGIATYAIGSDRQAAFLTGIVVKRTRVQAYLLSGVFAGLAGLVTTALLGSGSPQESIALGALLGYVIHFDTTGIEFVMTALFVVMLVGQWEEADDHRPALTGIVCSLVCLLLFGGDRFMLPAMALIILCFSLGRHKIARKEKEEARS